MIFMFLFGFSWAWVCVAIACFVYSFGLIVAREVAPKKRYTTDGEIVGFAILMSSVCAIIPPFTAMIFCLTDFGRHGWRIDIPEEGRYTANY